MREGNKRKKIEGKKEMKHTPQKKCMWENRKRNDKIILW